MAETLSLQDHLTFLPPREVFGYSEESKLSYSERLEAAGDPDAAFLLRNFETFGMYYSYLWRAGCRIGELITELTDRTVDAGRCHAEDLGDGYQVVEMYFHPCQENSEEEIPLAEMARSTQRLLNSLESLLQPLRLHLEKLNEKHCDFEWSMDVCLRAPECDTDHQGSSVYLSCEIWLLPCLISYLELLLQQKRALNEALSTNAKNESEPQFQSAEV